MLLINTLATTLILILNIFLFNSPVLGLIFGLFFIIFNCYLLAKIFFNFNYLYGFLCLLCAVIIPLTIIYYIYELNNWIIAGWLILFSVWVCFKRQRTTRDRRLATDDSRQTINNHCSGGASKQQKIEFINVLIYIILLSISYWLLKHGQTTEPVRTPWYFVPKLFFIFYFFTTGWLIYCCTKLKTAWCLILSGLHLFFTFSVANIIFPLGFGFDPFVHQATEKYILEYGFILPKKLYYIGQYVLVFFLTKILNISSVMIDRSLMPLLAAVLLPGTFYYTFKRIVSNAFNALMLFLIVPFSFLTFTTPQNLGYVLVLVMVFLATNNSQQTTNDLQLATNNKFLFYVLLLVVAIVFIHPLAGVAAFIFWLVLMLERTKLKKWLKCLIYILLSFSCVVAFLFFRIITGFEVKLANSFNLVNFYHNLFRWSPDLFWSTNLLHVLKSVAYFLWQPVVVFGILFVLAIIGLFLSKNPKSEIRNPKQVQNSKSKTQNIYYIITFIILFINSILLYSVIDFPFLIDYERGDFAYRVFTLATFFLIPLALMGVYKIFIPIIKLLNYHITKSHWIPRSNFVWLGMITIIISAGITTSLYFSYPRQDVYYYERGFNTSQYDFAAIKYLEDNTPEPYVVLANQQVGAGALFKYGFRYFQDKYFFYSIPTGGELYQIYWNIVYQNAGREEIKKASQLTGAKTVYVYFPNYWFNLKQLKLRLDKEAEGVLKLAEGKIWIFVFKF